MLELSGNSRSERPTRRMRALHPCDFLHLGFSGKGKRPQPPHRNKVSQRGEGTAPREIILRLELVGVTSTHPDVDP